MVEDGAVSRSVVIEVMTAVSDGIGVSIKVEGVGAEPRRGSWRGLGGAGRGVGAFLAAPTTT